MKSELKLEEILLWIEKEFGTGCCQECSMAMLKADAGKHFDMKTEPTKEERIREDYEVECGL